MVCIWEMLISTFNSLRCFSRDLGMVPSAPITIGTMEVFKIHNFWSSRFRFDNFQFSSVGKFRSGGLREHQNQQFLIGFTVIIISGLLYSIILSVWMLKTQRILDSFSLQSKGLCSYHFPWSLKPFFVQIPMHSLSYPAMSSFVFFLKKFRTLGNNVSDWYHQYSFWCW